TINESSVVCGPIGCTVDFRCRLIHLKIILWNKPLEIGLCNKAVHERKKFCIVKSFEVKINIILINIK
ncbi:hypothetical protein R5L37_19405, partial [Acinetobacter pittii]|nr:hypothetical protein [Acinetobacter pittii]